MGISRRVGGNLDEVGVMEYLRDMRDMEGWQLVETFINDRIKDHTDQLLTCEMEDIRKHRERVEAYKSVLLYVEDEIEKGMEALQQSP